MEQKRDKSGQAGRDREAESPPGRSQRHMELSQLEQEKGRGAVSASFPSNTKLLCLFSVIDRSTQLGNVSEKQIRLLLTLLTRLHRGYGRAPPEPGEGFGHSHSLWAEGWHLPGAAAQVPGEGAGGEASQGQGEASRGSLPLLVSPCSSFSPWVTCSWSHACCPAA